MKLTFEPTPKRYKRVKAVKLYLTGADGLKSEHELPVCMDTSGTPTFCMSAPPEYREAWEHHRSDEYANTYGPNKVVAFKDGWVHATTFEGAVDGLTRLSANYQRFLAQRNKRKVIVLHIETRTPDHALTYNAPSFSDSRVLVGLRADVYWDVHGQLYRDDRTAPGLRIEDDRDPAHETEPTFDDLRPAGLSTPQPGGSQQRGRGRDSAIAIPYTDEAWRTVCGIEDTLTRAAAMLVQLTGADAQALLEGGMQGLLAGPKDAPQSGDANGA